ncbi:MAG: serine/threonine-protein kinase [Sandaracinaceae bacterium]
MPAISDDNRAGMGGGGPTAPATPLHGASTAEATPVHDAVAGSAGVPSDALAPCLEAPEGPSDPTPSAEALEAPAPASVPDAKLDTTQGGHAVQERMTALVQREKIATFRRHTMDAVRVGIPFYMFFFALDVIAFFAGDPNWWVAGLVRGAFLPLAAGVYLLLARLREPSDAQLRAIETALFTGCLASITGVYGLRDGWASENIGEVSLVMLAYAVFLGGSWRRSLLPMLSMALVVPIVLLGMSPLLPEMGAQLSDPEVMGRFANHYSVVFVGAGLALFASNRVYDLRQQVAASRSIGRYDLRRRIAAGGMGEVWAAYHVGLQREVALKLIQPSLGEDPTAMSRFELEVKTLAELTHPNTIRVYDFGVTEAGVFYYAMELLDAEDLQKMVDTAGELDIDRTLRLATQAAEALGEAHARGIVHRDIKPANLLVVQPEGAGEYVKLIDFGIALPAESERDSALTRTGMVIGTPGYIAPEVVRGATATPRADVYALGMVLYVMLTGGTSFRATSPAAAAFEVLDHAQKTPSTERDDVPAALDALVQRCLSQDPDVRFATGSELARALRDIRAGR